MRCVLIAGYLRSFLVNYEKFKHIFDENTDIYFHITRDENNDKYFNKHDEAFQFIIKNIKVKTLLMESNECYSPDSASNNLFNIWHKYYKLNRIKCDYEHLHKFVYDTVIKLRPDMYLKSDVEFIVKPDTICIPLETKIDISKLSSPTDKYICDIFAYGDSKSMDKYFSVFDDLLFLTEKHGFVSETILYHHLHNLNDIIISYIDVKYDIILSTCNVIAICGDSGSGKSTLSAMLSQLFSDSFVLECDRYHKWERKSDNWNTYTHLNPEANYIMKMTTDVFTLKTMNDVYQINYDHKNGTFTDTEHIKKSSNVIVCGLHCLYSNIKMYNLKIFMDTDTPLKIKWKLERDLKDRGKNMDDIIKQIENRVPDYKQFIEPQKLSSDLVIRFYEENGNIFLSLLVSNRIDISRICFLFKKYNIIYNLAVDDLYNKLVFGEYFFDNNIYEEITHKPCLYNNYYDIILFIIIHIVAQ